MGRIGLITAGIVLIVVGTIGNWVSPNYGLDMSLVELLFILGWVVFSVGLLKVIVAKMKAQ
jgi:hypothetical protein